MKWLRDEAAAIEKAREKAHAAGSAEGRAEGAHEKQCQIARALLAKKMAINTIAEITGLSIGTIEAMSNSFSNVDN